MVDRITPAATDDDRRLVEQACGYVDADPVATEPFHEWVISGAFPAGRPRWEEAGVTIVDDVVPFEQRKLWFLNASHSHLAYAASIRGFATIDEAIADPECRAEVELLWDEASRHLELPGDSLTDYRQALLARFSNPRMRDQLARIAADGSVKLPVRILPTVRAERAAGRLPLGGATTLAAWVLHLRGLGAPVNDPGAGPALAAANSGDLRGRRTGRPGRAGAGPGRRRRVRRRGPGAGEGHPTAMSGPAEVIIGVDVGTTAVKVAAFDVHGGPGPLPTALREYPLEQPEPGWQVQDPPAVLAALDAAVAECVGLLGRARILALSISTAMHGLIGLDSQMRPLTPLVTWADSRAGEQARELRRQGQALELLQLTGTPVHPMSPLVKLIWFSRQAPALTRRVRWWVGLKDYVLHHLTGELVTELSSASATGLLSVHTRDWDESALALAGIQRDQLPRVLPTTTVLALTPKAAARIRAAARPSGRGRSRRRAAREPGYRSHSAGGGRAVARDQRRCPDGGQRASLRPRWAAVLLRAHRRSLGQRRCRQQRRHHGAVGR